ncbi:MAG: NAD(P)H-dependent oxidoreductase [Flavobacteriales bacterium]|nr:NAD(P)H-dependent oxidoreductase [Flavobacteriales bacterium]
MMKIAIIVGSTRPGRNGIAVGKWFHEQVKKRKDVSYELVDIQEFDLPFLDEPKSPMQGNYQQPHTKKWSKKIDPFDAFILVTPEYNHGTSAALKNALDFLYKEWNNKPVGFVSYGSDNGTRAVEQLRQVIVELQMASIRTQLALSLYEDFEKFTKFQPRAQHKKKIAELCDQLELWANGFARIRKIKEAAERD